MLSYGNCTRRTDEMQPTKEKRITGEYGQRRENQGGRTVEREVGSRSEWWCLYIRNECNRFSIKAHQKRIDGAQNKSDSNEQVQFIMFFIWCSC